MQPRTRDAIEHLGDVVSHVLTATGPGETLADVVLRLVDAVDEHKTATVEALDRLTAAVREASARGSTP